MKSFLARTVLRMLPAVAALLALSCDPGPVEHPDPPFTDDLEISPAAITLHPGQSQRFVVVDTTVADSIVWSVVDGPGAITADGLYTVPATVAGDTLRFWIEARATSRFGRAHITIAPGHDTPACFERDVQPIIRSNCALSGCHDPGGREGGYDFTTYLGVRQAVVPGRADRSIMVLKITEDDEHERMPPEPREPLSESEIATIIHWINDGALGSPCPGDAPCDTSGVTYSGTISGIMNDGCVGCHAPGAPNSGGIDLTTYAGVRAVALTGQLYGSVAHAPGYAPMPSPTDTIDACRRLQIRHWIDLGAPEN